MNDSNLLQTASARRFFRAWRIRLVVLLAAGCITVGSARASNDSGCVAPEDFGAPLPELPTLHAAREAGRPITIVVLASSLTAEGDAASDGRYSDHLIQHLSRHWRANPLNLVEVDYEGQTAAEIAGQIPDVLARYRPDLLIWESGAVDAARGVDVAEFAQAVEAGIQSAEATETALVLMDPRYDERFPLWTASEPYVDTLSQIVRGYPVLLFSLHELTRYWETEDTRPRSAGGQQHGRASDSASDCVAALLAGMISAASDQ